MSEIVSPTYKASLSLLLQLINARGIKTELAPTIFCKIVHYHTEIRLKSENLIRLGIVFKGNTEVRRNRKFFGSGI